MVLHSGSFVKFKHGEFCNFLEEIQIQCLNKYELKFTYVYKIYLYDLLDFNCFVINTIILEFANLTCWVFVGITVRE